MPRITPNTTLTIEIDDMTRSGPTASFTTSDQAVHSYTYAGDLDRACAASQLGAVSTAQWARVNGSPATDYVRCTATASASTPTDLIFVGVVLTKYDEAAKQVTFNSVSPSGSFTLTLANVTEALRAAQALSIGSRTSSNVQLQQTSGTNLVVEMFLKL